MAKGEAKKNNQMLDRYYSDSQRRYNDLNAQNQDMLNTARQRNDEVFNNLNTRYNQVLDDPNAFGRNHYDEFARTGGMDPTRVGQADADAARYRQHAGGQDETGQFWRNLMQTGGWSEDEQRDFRARGNSVAPSMYANLKREMETQNRAQGGYSPGFSGSMARLSREGTRAASDANLQTETTMQEAIRRGKALGATNLADAFRIGMAGANDINMNLMDMTQRGRMFGATGMASADRSRVDTMNSLRGLRTDVPGELNMAIDNILQSHGLQDNNAARMIAMRIQNNPNISFWDKLNAISNAISSAAGAVGVGKGLGQAKGGYGGGNTSAGNLKYYGQNNQVGVA